jgi:hypothetical protein
MRVAISQSNYVPWAGYFGIIAQTDVFVFLDEVQFTTRDWRSRNRIKEKTGLKWLSIPVGDSRNRRILDVKLPKNGWEQKHKMTIKQAYQDAPNYKTGIEIIEAIYGDNNFDNLSDFNKHWIKFFSTEIFGLKCKFFDSDEIDHRGTASELILSISKNLSATHYLTGPSAVNYLKIDDFSHNNIEVNFADYSNMATYTQLHGEFVQTVSILDMIFNVQSGYADLIKIDTVKA